jgi:hypothetical protein
LGYCCMQTRAIKTLQELDNVQSYWEKWQNHPNNDFDQFNYVCQLRDEVECPCVTVIERNSQPYALLAGRLEQTHFAPSIGYLKPAKISAKVLTVIHEGFLGQLDDETAKEAVHYLWSLLSAGLADAIQFHHLSEHSPLLKALLVHGSPLFCEKKPRWSLHWQMSVPEEGGYIENKMRSKHRYWIRKKQRELESAFPGRVSWTCMKRFDDIPELCKRLEEVAALTYQRGLGSGFFDNEEYRQRFALFARRGLLRVQLLEIDGRARAFWFGTVYDGVFHASETGYDPDLRTFEVGTLLFIQTVDELAREGVRKIDFGGGDAHYKQRFGDESWQEATLWMFAPTAKGLAFRTMLRSCIMLDSAARRILQRVKLIDKLKTKWRRCLTKGAADVEKAEN